MSLLLHPQHVWRMMKWITWSLHGYKVWWGRHSLVVVGSTRTAGRARRTSSVCTVASLFAHTAFTLIALILYFRYTKYHQQLESFHRCVFNSCYPFQFTQFWFLLVISTLFFIGECLEILLLDFSTVYFSVCSSKFFCNSTVEFSSHLLLVEFMCSSATLVQFLLYFFVWEEKEVLVFVFLWVLAQSGWFFTKEFICLWILTMNFILTVLSLTFFLGLQELD